MYLFFDTETTGLPCSPTSDYRNWPRLVQLAWILTDDQGTEKQRHSLIIHPKNFTIPKRAAEIHGITTQRARNEGVDLKFALRQFLIDTTYTDALVCHNYDYDYGVLRGELLRHNIPDFLRDYHRYCTMKSRPVIDYCKVLRNYDRRKWPRLSELYYLLFQKQLLNNHDALADAEACKDCFFELQRLGIIKDTPNHCAEKPALS